MALVWNALSLSPTNMAATATAYYGRYAYDLMPQGTLEVWVDIRSLSPTNQGRFEGASLIYTNSAGQTISEHYPSPTLTRCQRELPRIAKGTAGRIVCERLHLYPEVELWMLNYGHSRYNVYPQGELKLVLDYNPLSLSNRTSGRFVRATLTYTNRSGVVTEEFPK